MFDIGFPELLLLSVVALVVLGPKRLPEAMRAVGAWYNQLRYAASRLRQELDHELNYQIDATVAPHQETIKDLKQLKNETQEVIDQTRDAVELANKGVEPPIAEQDHQKSEPA